MPICAGCNKEKTLRNPRAGGLTAMCEDCWKETESDLGGGQEILEIDHIATHLLTVLRQNPDMPMRQVIDWEQRLFEEPDDGSVRGMYGDWLEERKCSVRAEEVRRPSAPTGAGAGGAGDSYGMDVLESIYRDPNAARFGQTDTTQAERVRRMMVTPEEKPPEKPKTLKERIRDITGDVGP